MSPRIQFNHVIQKKKHPILVFKHCSVYISLYGGFLCSNTIFRYRYFGFNGTYLLLYNLFSRTRRSFKQSKNDTMDPAKYFSITHLGQVFVKPLGTSKTLHMRYG